MTPATRQLPDRNLALELVRVTEAAALAAAPLVGLGDKEAADQAAVDGMRYMLHSVQMDGVVVIGEGEKDEAPMLYNGEQIGDGSPPAGRHRRRPARGHDARRARDAERAGGDRAVGRGTMFDPGPCVYMEKMAGAPEIADLLDLDRPLGETVQAGRRAQGLPGRRRDGRRARPSPPRAGDRGDPRGRRARAADRPRRRLGGAAGGHRALARRSAVGDRRHARGRDLGGRREVPRRPAARAAVAARRATSAAPRCEAGYDLERVLTRDDLVAGEDVFFSATGITDGDVLQGVRYPSAGGATTESLVTRSRSGTIRRIRATHDRAKLRAVGGERY